MRERRAARAKDTAAPRAPVSPKAMAVRWLARREYSRAELAQRLQQRGVTAAGVERALDELAAAGYLSDARYAQAVVAQRAGRYGRRAILHALKERGIGIDDAASAIAALDGADEYAEAQALWRQRFGAAPANDRETARQVRFLQARGYSVSVALRVLRAAGRRSDDL
ncbi:MAG: regulatory protein RecX [Burkholderiales bacterium]|nr:regulatory protein RecX [Burkholderiales bacterium]